MPDAEPTPESSDDPYVRALISVEVRLAMMGSASEGRHEAILSAIGAAVERVSRLEGRLETAERALTRLAEAEHVEAKAIERRATEEVEARGWLRHQVDDCVAWVRPRIDAMAENRAVQLAAVGVVAAFGNWIVRHLSGTP